MQSSVIPLRGVNFGGWLVLERWMTPQLFAGTDAKDEYSFMQTPGAEKKIKQHRDSFITEEDFQWLADNGYTAVRIPVGYWIFDGDGPYLPCIDYLDWAVKMATKYKLKILICLHGAPGSQNGNDHSGRIGRAGWYGNPAYRQQSIDVIVRLADRYKQRPAVWGIELLNEPKAWYKLWILRRYHSAAYKAVQTVGRKGLVTIFSDAFTPRLMSGSLKAVADYPVMMDTHWYHFFMPKWIQRILPFSFYQWQLRRRVALLQRLSKTQPIVMGEWSGVIGGEALSRFDTAKHKELTYQHLRDQQHFFTSLAGWFYWNYKTERRGIFHFRSMNEDGHTEPPF